MVFEENIICFGHMKHMKSNFREDAVNAFHRCGGPPPSKREVLGLRRSRPSALPSIGYRGFAVAPKTLRAPSRSLLYNPGDERTRNARPYRVRRCNQLLQ